MSVPSPISVSVCYVHVFCMLKCYNVKYGGRRDELYSVHSLKSVHVHVPCFWKIL